MIEIKAEGYVLSGLSMIKAAEERFFQSSADCDDYLASLLFQYAQLGYDVDGTRDRGRFVVSGVGDDFIISIREIGGIHALHGV